jgi:hypothetical protein
MTIIEEYGEMIVAIGFTWFLIGVFAGIVSEIMK